MREESRLSREARRKAKQQHFRQGEVQASYGFEFFVCLLSSSSSSSSSSPLCKSISSLYFRPAYFLFACWCAVALMVSFVLPLANFSLSPIGLAV